jgi:hypothetical protein
MAAFLRADAEVIDTPHHFGEVIDNPTNSLSSVEFLSGEQSQFPERERAMNHALDPGLSSAGASLGAPRGPHRSFRSRSRTRSTQASARSRLWHTNPDVPYEGLPDATAIVGRVRVGPVGVATITMRAGQ